MSHSSVVKGWMNLFYTWPVALATAGRLRCRWMLNLAYLSSKTQSLLGMDECCSWLDRWELKPREVTELCRETWLSTGCTSYCCLCARFSVSLSFMWFGGRGWWVSQHAWVQIPPLLLSAAWHNLSVAQSPPLWEGHNTNLWLIGLKDLIHIRNLEWYKGWAVYNISYCFFWSFYGA